MSYYKKIYSHCSEQFFIARKNCMKKKFSIKNKKGNDFDKYGYIPNSSIFVSILKKKTMGVEHQREGGMNRTVKISSFQTTKTKKIKTCRNIFQLSTKKNSTNMLIRNFNL